MIIVRISVILYFIIFYAFEKVKKNGRDERNNLNYSIVLNQEGHFIATVLLYQVPGNTIEWLLRLPRGHWFNTMSQNVFRKLNVVANWWRNKNALFAHSWFRKIRTGGHWVVDDKIEKTFEGSILEKSLYTICNCVCYLMAAGKQPSVNYWEKQAKCYCSTGGVLLV